MSVDRPLTDGQRVAGEGDGRLPSMVLSHDEASAIAAASLAEHLAKAGPALVDEDDDV